ncbi:MAG TPA: cyclic nucleotide-binding domain-containing protein [Planctomycetaceae bacterium]|nr:cyclic nucleotide-binding domain-containing protein [Planctomycetaceae bacterium]
MSPSRTLTVTPGFDLISDFQGEDDNDLLSVAEPRVLHRGDVLITEGAPQPGLFIVTRGLLDVRVGTQQPVSVGIRGPGDLLGEVSLLTGEGANASVVALETCELLALPAEALQEQLKQNTRFAARFYQLLGRVVARKLTEQSRRALPFSLAITHSPEFDARLRGTVHQIKARLSELEAELARQKGQVSEDVRIRTTAILDEALEFLRTLFGPESEVPAALQPDVAQFFRQELLPLVLLSRVCEQGYTKRRGYAGDFQVIDLLYGNQPAGVGHLGPLLDEYFLNIPVARAVRNRRALLVDVFLERLDASAEGRLNITSLACGPAREIFDFFERIDDPRKAVFHCIDLDVQALSEVSRVADQRGLGQSIRLMQENLILLATGRRPASLPPQDLMYSIGLIDYFQDKLVIRLLNWIHQTLRPGGQVVLGNFDPRSPDRPFMDHLLEWPLIYRTPDDVRRLFARSAFGERPVDVRYEPQGINLFATCAR